MATSNAPNAAKVAAKRAQADIRQHFLTNKQRVNVTKDMSLSFSDQDLKSFEQFSLSLTSDTAVSLASPAFGISQHMQLFFCLMWTTVSWGRGCNVSSTCCTKITRSSTCSILSTIFREVVTEGTFETHRERRTDD